MEADWHKTAADTESQMTRNDSLNEESGGAGADHLDNGQISHEAMAREIRSWAKWLLGFGVLNVVLSAFSNSFGVLLIVVGIASHLVQVPAMFVVIAVTLAWAAVSNLLSVFMGHYGGIFWAIIQILLVFRTLHQYADYRQWERQRSLPSAEHRGIGRDRAAQIFPLGGCLFSALAATGAIGVIFLIGIMVEISAIEEPPGVFLFAYGVLVQLGVLGIALGLASLFSGYRYKLLALMGVLVGGLLEVANFYFALSG